MKPTLLIDFDGVLHHYTGNFDIRLHGPIENARRACCILAKRFKLVCFTSRSTTDLVQNWLDRNGFPIKEVTSHKRPAHLILDDRCVCFDGRWTDDLIQRLIDFRPWWKDSTAPLEQLLDEGVEDSGNAEQDPPPSLK